MRIFEKVSEFQWDRGNIDKNLKHNVKDREAEEPFFDRNRRIYKDMFHSKDEARHIAIGKTKKKQLLYTFLP